MKRVLSLLFTLTLFATLACTTTSTAATTRTPPPDGPYNDIEYESLYDGIVKETLPNGLVVLVKEDYRAPVITARCYIRTGAIHEEEFLGAGISHFLEHALFLGTDARPEENQIQAEIEALGGGNFNAHTSSAHTCYHFTISSEFFKEGVNILFDMVAQSTLPKDRVDRERVVIHKEMAMGMDSASRYFSKLFMRSFFTTHPYRYPIIGYREAYDTISRDDLMAYYKRRYVPNNMVLVIVGAASKEEIMASVKETFATMQRKPLKDVYIPEEPTHTTRKVVIERTKKFRVPTADIGFQTVTMFSEDMYPLDLLATIISEAETGMLSKTLVQEKQIVDSTYAYSWTPNSTRGIFGLYATLKAGVTVETFEAEVSNILARVQEGAITDDDIIRAKTRTIARFVFSQKSVEGIAGDIGGNEIWANDAHFSLSYLAGIKSVTRDDIIRVARKYFRFDRATVVALLPEDENADTNTVAKVASDTPPRLTTFTLDNGLSVVYRRKQMPTVSLVAVMNGGILFETEGNNGAFSLMADTMIKGTKTYDKDTLYRTINGKGGSLFASSGFNTVSVGMELLKNDFSEGVAILQSLLREATFNEEDLALVKQEKLFMLKQQEQNIFYFSSERFGERLYEGHPYALNRVGTASVIEALTQEDMLALYDEYVVGKNIVLGIVGDLPEDEVKRVIEEAFSALPEGRVPAGGTFELPPITETKTYVDYMPGREQTVVRFGFRGPSRYEDDYYTVAVLLNVLDGMGGRLFGAVRGENALAYMVGAYQSAKYKSGTIVFYTATATKEKKTDKAIDIMVAEMEKITKEGNIGDEEFARAMNIVKTEIDIRLQNPASEASALASRVLYGEEPKTIYTEKDAFNRVTKEAAVAAAKRYFARYILSVVTQEDKTKEDDKDENDDPAPDSE